MAKVDRAYNYYVAFYLYTAFDNSRLMDEYNIDVDDIFREFYYYAKDVFGDSFDYNNPDNRTCLFYYIDSIFKYRLLTDKTQHSYDVLVQLDKDNYIIDNYSKLEKLIKQIGYKVRGKGLYNPVDFPKLDHDQLDKYFREFLLFVDKDGEYLKIYEEMLKDERIIYLDNFEENSKRVFLDSLNIHGATSDNLFWKGSEEAYFLFLTRKGDILDFRNLAHEFMHYVSFKTGNRKISRVVGEFPSIFYELLANKFLLRKGYDKESVDNCFKDRYGSIETDSYYFQLFNYYLNIYRESGTITREEDVYRRREELLDPNKRSELMSLLSYLNAEIDCKDPIVLADYLSSNAIIVHSLSPNLIVGGFEYPIGGYLALKEFRDMLKNKNFDEVLSKMKDYTFNIENLDVDKLLNIKEGKNK